MSAKLHDTEISLEASKAREQETKEKLTDELAKATKELCHTRTIALKNKELAALREAELEKEKLQEYALHNKASDLLNNLKQAKSSNREALVQKKMVEDELDELKKEHSKIKSLSEKLQVRVVQLKSELENDRAQRKRERIIAIANDHLRNMKAHMGLVFQTEPWPVSSTHSTGTLLSTVKKGCAGFSSGLRKGDVVTEMNGKQTRSKTEFYAAMFGVKSGDMMHCHIIRPSQGPGIVRAIDVHMGAEGYSLKQVLAIKRLAERKANVYDIEFDVDVKLSGLEGLGCD